MNSFSHRAPLRSARTARRTRGGFTMVEMIVTMTIMGLIIGMVLQFNFDAYKSMFISEQKCSINKDVRTITAQMSEDARQASFFVMYANYTAAARVNSTMELPQANSGDFLVLVYYGDPPDPAHFNVRPVDEIIGYYRAPFQTGETDPITNDNGTYQPVRKFDLSVANGTIPANRYLESTNMPAGGTCVTLESLLPSDSAATIRSHQVVVQLAQGLNDGLLFHNFWGKSVMINGKIVHGNNNTSATDTYNFTISPRG